MGIFSYNPSAPQGGGRLSFGVHKVRVNSVNVKVSSAGAGYNVSCEIETEDGKIAKYVSIGYFYNITDPAQFEKSKEDYTKYKAMSREAYFEKDEAVRTKAVEAANTFRNSVSDNIHYKLVSSLTDLADFVSGFSSEAREAVASVDVDTIEELLNAYGKILSTSGYAYVFLYEASTTSKDGSKVYQNVNLSQNFMAPRSFSVNTVKEVVPEFKTQKNKDEEPEKVFVGYKVVFLNGKSVTLALTDKTFQGGIKPTDKPNEAKDDIPVLAEGDDLPF